MVGGGETEWGLIDDVVTVEADDEGDSPGADDTGEHPCVKVEFVVTSSGASANEWVTKEVDNERETTEDGTRKLTVRFGVSKEEVGGECLDSDDDVEDLEEYDLGEASTIAFARLRIEVTRLVLCGVAAAVRSSKIFPIGGPLA